MKTIGIIQNVHQCVYQHFWNFEYTRKMAELEGGYFSPELNGHPVSPCVRLCELAQITYIHSAR